jgi:hypothetical protein
MTTTNLGMTIPTVGADTDNWGNELNNNLGLIDAFAGTLMPQSAAKLGSLAIAGAAPGANTLATNGSANIGGSLTVAQNLTVYGTSGITCASVTATNGTLAVTGYGVQATLDINGSIYSTSGNGITMQAHSGGVLLNNGATSWTSASERAKKKNFQPIRNPLELVGNIRAELGHYSWEGDDAKLRPFVFYEDAQKYWPWAATHRQACTRTHTDEKTGATSTQEIPEFKGVSYELYVPLLLAAFHQQIGINDDLRARVAALEAAG